MTSLTNAARWGLTAMRPRDPHEPHRAASPLELFFDLVFVVAVSLASQNLHHAESESHVGAGVLAYLMVFFAIWWAWMNFTWFATAFDTDDWLYRVLTVLQMGGVLILAAGIHSAMVDGDYTIVTWGYVVMRLVMVTQWMRAAKNNPGLRATAVKYAVGISAVQVLWLLRLLLPPETGVVTFLILVVAEVSVPVWAERARPVPWHPHHIAERFGLFTIIVLGESILASANAIIDASSSAEHLTPLVLLAVCGLLLAAGMWWVYFSTENHSHFTNLASSLRFGYIHGFIFAAAGAFSAGIEVAIDLDTHSTELSSVAAASTLTVPVAVFVLAVWGLTLRRSLPRWANIAVPVLASLLGLSAFAPASIPVATVLMIGIVAVVESQRRGSQLTA